MRKILYLAGCLLISTPAMAKIIWDANPGDYCTEECQELGHYCPMVYEVPLSDISLSDIDVSNCSDDDTGDCLMSADSNYAYVCYSTAESYCEYFTSYKKPDCTQTCTTHNSNSKKCVRGRYTDNNGTCGCIYTSYYLYTEYGCNAGYYPESGNNTASIVCKPCPNGGKSPEFSKGISSCYMPANSTFSDATGGGRYNNNCYW